MSIATNFTLDYPKSIDKCTSSPYISQTNTNIAYSTPNTNNPSNNNNNNNIHLNSVNSLVESPENWDFTMQLYMGSITVIGLYILFKLVKKSKM